MLKLLLEIGKGTVASVIVLIMFRIAGWVVDHAERWIPTEATFSYSFLKTALDYVGVASAVIIMSIYTVKGIITLFSKGGRE